MRIPCCFYLKPCISTWLRSSTWPSHFYALLSAFGIGGLSGNAKHSFSISILYCKFYRYSKHMSSVCPSYM